MDIVIHVSPTNPAMVGGKVGESPEEKEGPWLTYTTL